MNLGCIYQSRHKAFAGVVRPNENIKWHQFNSSVDYWPEVPGCHSEAHGSTVGPRPGLRCLLRYASSTWSSLVLPVLPIGTGSYRGRSVLRVAESRAVRPPDRRQGLPWKITVQFSRSRFPWGVAAGTACPGGEGLLTWWRRRAQSAPARQGSACRPSGVCAVPANPAGLRQSSRVSSRPRRVGLRTESCSPHRK
jgi:hypothetical protein